MSKIGKRAILLLLALPIGFNVMAQETKKPTLEELIPGGESYRYADNLYGLQWWGDECIKLVYWMSKTMTTNLLWVLLLA